MRRMEKLDILVNNLVDGLGIALNGKEKIYSSHLPDELGEEERICLFWKLKRKIGCYYYVYFDNDKIVIKWWY